MKEKLKIILPFFFLTVVLMFPLVISARSGCCSHHGGVCGCRCCDGTSLSTTCAPYSPQCSTPKSKPSIQQPPTAQQPVTQQNTENSRTDNNSIDSNKLLAELPKEDSGGSFWWWIIGIGVVAYLFYAFRKRK